MKTSKQLAAVSIFLLVGTHAASARKSGNSASPLPPAAQGAASVTPDTSSNADAYYDFLMGHYYAQQYEITSRAEDANKSIDFYKKAFALDSSSQQIGDELAEIYFQSQHIRDAVTEAQSMLSKDPQNLGAHRLLARIYVRTLGDMSDTSGQHDTLVRASEQYREILRLDPTDSDAAIWLARLYRLQNDHDKA